MLRTPKTPAQVHYSECYPAVAAAAAAPLPAVDPTVPVHTRSQLTDSRIYLPLKTNLKIPEAEFSKRSGPEYGKEDFPDWLLQETIPHDCTGHPVSPSTTTTPHPTG